MPSTLKCNVLKDDALEKVDVGTEKGSHEEFQKPWYVPNHIGCSKCSENN